MVGFGRRPGTTASWVRLSVLLAYSGLGSTDVLRLNWQRKQQFSPCTDLEVGRDVDRNHGSAHERGP